MAMHVILSLVGDFWCLSLIDRGFFSHISADLVRDTESDREREAHKRPLPSHICGSRFGFLSLCLIHHEH